MVPLQGRNNSRGGSFGRFMRRRGKAVTAIVLVLVLLITATAMSISSLISMLEEQDEEDQQEGNAGAFTTVTLYVQATNLSDKPVANVTVDLQPTTKNKDGSEIKMPATGKDGIASTVIGTSGGAFDAPTNGTSYYMTCSAYNPSGQKQKRNFAAGIRPLTHSSGVTNGDHKLRCQPGVIAADPFIFPHGTIVYIQEVSSKTLKPTGYVYGYAESADTGTFLDRNHNNYGTASASQGSKVAGYAPQGAHDRKGGKVYKRGADLWFDTVGEASQFGVKLCKITIVDATKPGCYKGADFSGRKSSGNGAYERQATYARLVKARGGTVLNGSGGVTTSYGDYTVTCTGGLTCGKYGASGSLDVDSLVQGVNTKQKITIPGGYLYFWVDISSDSGDSDFDKTKSKMSKGEVTINGHHYILFSQAAPAFDSTFVQHGCCPSSLAIVGTGFGLKITPKTIANEHGGYSGGWGQYSNIGNSKQSLIKRGVKVSGPQSVSTSAIVNYLKTTGNPVVVRFQGGHHTVGTYTYGNIRGHFFTILGYREKNGGQVFIGDPGNYRSDNNGWYSTSVISKAKLKAWYKISK